MTINLYAAWIGFLLGALAGAITGLFFRDERWLGGYAGWRRRMVRLGHVAFFGIGFLNLGFALTVGALRIETGVELLPVVCYLAAFRDGFRHLFFVPAGSVIVAIAAFLWRLALR
jgi:hypothetical protein